jgi:hypothetical protein
MSNDLVVQLQNSIANVENMSTLSKKLFEMPHYKKLGLDGIFMVVSYANSLGIDAMEALNGGLYNINGKIGMAAETMARLVRRAGHSISKDAKSDDTICVLHGKRKDNGDTWTTSFSVAEAKKAGIYKGPWEKYPAAMCYNRAMSFLFRQLFPDLAKNAGYVKDELEEMAANEHGSKVETITISDISDEQKLELYEIKREFPDLIDKALNALGSEKTIDDINARYYQGIVTRAKFMRQKREEEASKFNQEIALEYAQ